MTPEEIAVKIEGHEHELKSLKHRMDNQEEESRSIQQLVISVERIALSTEHIMQEQEEQGKRLKVLEGRDGDMWRKVVSHMATVVMGIVIGYIFKLIGM